MPYRRKDSAVWWASYVDASGQRVRRPTGTTERKEAEALEAKWKLQVYRQSQWDEPPTRTFAELMVAYLKATAGERRSEAKVRMHVKRMRTYFGCMEMNGLTPANVREYIATRRGQGVSNATINRELEVLSAAVNYANKEWDWQLPNPVSGRKLREPQGRVRWISRSEADALVQAAESEPRAPHLAQLIALALNTGMRRGEMLGLEWQRVDLSAGLVHLEAMHTKAGRRRSVPLNQSSRRAILAQARFRAEHCPGSPWVFSDAQGRRIIDVKRSFATACRRAGIEDFRFHDLRHTCAAWLVSAGVPLTEVRDLLGHSSVKVTERYAHLAPENVRAAVAVLDAGESRSGHVVASASRVGES